MIVWVRLQIHDYRFRVWVQWLGTNMYMRLTVIVVVCVVVCCKVRCRVLAYAHGWAIGWRVHEQCASEPFGFGFLEGATSFAFSGCVQFQQGGNTNVRLVIGYGCGVVCVCVMVVGLRRCCACMCVCQTSRRSGSGCPVFVTSLSMR